MKAVNAVVGGIVGACALTALHQIVKKKDKNAPRMDLLGMEAITKVLQKFDAEIPENKKLYYITMAGDIFSNAIYYSIAGLGKKTLLKGAGLGLAAGVGSVFLPKPIGLNEAYSNRTKETQLLAIGYYFAGGLISSAAMLLLKSLTESKSTKLLNKLKD
jgi:hypothetical protein